MAPRWQHGVGDHLGAAASKQPRPTCGTACAAGALAVALVHLIGKGRRRLQPLRAKQITDLWQYANRDYFMKDYQKNVRVQFRNHMYKLYKKRNWKLHYKRNYRRVCRYYKKDAEEVPKTLEEFKEELRPLVDNTLLMLDEHAVDAIICYNYAMRLKFKMLQHVQRLAVKFKLIERPTDKHMPPWIHLGWTLPQTDYIRPPRPWNLPGYKSQKQIFMEKRLEVKRMQELKEKEKEAETTEAEAK